MTEREQFEAAYRETFPNVCALFPGKFDQDEFGEYVQTAVEIAWQIWQASRRAALDENMRDAARYRAFFDAGLPVCFCGTDYYTKSELDAAIDAVLSPTET